LQSTTSPKPKAPDLSPKPMPVNSPSHSTNSGFHYTPPIFGIPSTITPRHSNIKLSVTARIFGSSKETPSNPISFETGTRIGNNIPGVSVPVSDGGLFNQETAGTDSKILSS
jgi:hypothetical protein